MNRYERRAARLAVIAEERAKGIGNYCKRAARRLNLTDKQVRYLASWWGLTCRKK